MSAKQADGKNCTRQAKLNTYAVACGGIALCVALMLAYIEAILPFNIGIPAVKIGLPNIVSVFLLYKAGGKSACTVSALRVIIAALLFGNISGFIYSAAGCIFSLTVMLLIKRTRLFTPIGVSVAGGIAHNIGQICGAAVLLGMEEVLYYLPVLIIGGTVSGCAVGIVSGILIKKIKLRGRVI